MATIQKKLSFSFYRQLEDVCELRLFSFLTLALEWCEVEVVRGWCVPFQLLKLEEWRRTILHCQKLKSDVCLIALSQFYSTVCKMDMSVIMYCYCSFVSSGAALRTLLRSGLFRVLLLTLDTEEEPTSPSSSRCKKLVYPGWSSRVAWSGMGFNADSRLSSVINNYLLDKEIHISPTEHYPYHKSQI